MVACVQGLRGGEKKLTDTAEFGLALGVGVGDALEIYRCVQRGGRSISLTILQILQVPPHGPLPRVEVLVQAKAFPIRVAARRGLQDEGAEQE